MELRQRASLESGMERSGSFGFELNVQRRIDLMLDVRTVRHGEQVAVKSGECADNS